MTTETLKAGSHIGPASGTAQPFISKWSSRYRGATVQDLEPPSALSVNPADRIATALATAFERDYTHLTVVDGATRALLGYVAMPALQAQLAAGTVRPDDAVAQAMTRFRRLRATPALRALVRENTLTPSDLIWPL